MKERSWVYNLRPDIFLLVLALVPTFFGYRDYLELQEKDVVYIINNIVPIPGELVMWAWFGLAVYIAFPAISGILFTLGRRIQGDKRYLTSYEEEELRKSMKKGR